jgi:sulfite exporter TauE/SafE
MDNRRSTEVWEFRSDVVTTLADSLGIAGSALSTYQVASTKEAQQWLGVIGGILLIAACVLLMYVANRRRAAWAAEQAMREYRERLTNRAKSLDRRSAGLFGLAGVASLGLGIATLVANNPEAPSFKQSIAVVSATVLIVIAQIGVELLAMSRIGIENVPSRFKLAARLAPFLEILGMMALAGSAFFNPPWLDQQAGLYVSGAGVCLGIVFLLIKRFKPPRPTRVTPGDPGQPGEPREAWV